MTKQEEVQEGYARFLYERTEHDGRYCAKNYDDLKNKEFWLWLAYQHLEYLHAQGVVIVDRELPYAQTNIRGNKDWEEGFEHGTCLERHNMLQAGYVALIKEEK